MSREEFDNLTDEETAIYVKQVERKLDREARNVALVAWAIFSSGGAKKEGGGSFTIDDFIPRKPLSEKTKEDLLKAQMQVMADRQEAASRRALAEQTTS